MRAATVLLAALCAFSFADVRCEDYTPIVMWHGMGDSCCFPFSLGAVKRRLERSLPGAHVVALRIGDSVAQDVEHSYFMHPDAQVRLACSLLAADRRLAAGYNALGFSQGAQFLRAVAQRCPDPPMRNYISLGGQHQGVYGIPNCGTLSNSMCDYIRKLLNHAAYIGWVQRTLTQATYWHDPLNEELFKKASTFLADINNENAINQTYKDNLLKLENFVLVRFENDSIVQPLDTEWFGFYKPGQSVELQPLEDSALYKEDRLGLQQMAREKRLHFLNTPGNHLQFTWEWFEENVMNVFLNNTRKSTT